MSEGNTLPSARGHWTVSRPPRPPHSDLWSATHSELRHLGCAGGWPVRVYAGSREELVAEVAEYERTWEAQRWADHDVLVKAREDSMLQALAGRAKP